MKRKRVKGEKPKLGRVPVAPPTQEHKPNKGKGSYDRKREKDVRST